ncbi:SART-1 protein [Fomitiporia mediterranea MF3/22]|uniref:SART-1 protein n=1 Tax=Fomitiporia mediterranea (strain MF3/22) TaxID=694068 RepID=UPI0004407F9A|nr:SART-1 protein [Fomitiporia mediterranea MF3/22]EJD06694.1 SART-1 protein [Fomitiporia mediterranea MF3/22]
MEESISLEETNKIRISLGLKPLTDDKAPADNKEKEAENNYAKKREEEEKERDKKRLQDKIAKVKNKRELNASLKGATLGDADAEADDTLKWIKKAKKREKELAKKRVEELENMDKQFQGDEYTEKDIEGLKVAHDFEELGEGEDRILTLKDSRILDNEEDELQNVEMAEIERVKKSNELKMKKRDYKGYDDDEFAEGQAGIRRSILAKYDEDLEGPKETGFRLGANVPSKSVQLKEEQERAATSVNKSLLSIDYAKNLEVADYVQEGDVGFKKPKTKKKRPSRRVAEDSGIEPINGENGMEVDEKPTASRVRNLDVNFVDDDELQASLARARRAKTMRKPKVLTQEEIAKKLTEERARQSAAPEDSVVKVEDEEDSGLVFDDTSEFVRSVQYDPTAVKPKVEPQEQSIKQEPSNGDVHMHDEEEMDEVEAGEVTMKEEEDEEVMLHELQNAIQSAEAVVKKEEEDAEVGTASEQTYGAGLASTLKSLRQQGILAAPTADLKERERVQKQRDLWLADYRARQALRELERVKAKGEKKDQAQREYENRLREQQEARENMDLFNDYKPDVNIVYHDEFGRELTPKEAWKALSHRFHGKGSGKMKTEKRLKKIAEEKKKEAMISGDTPLSMNRAFQMRQEKAGQAHFVLSVGNRGAVPQAAEFLDPPTLSKGKTEKTKKKKSSAAKDQSLAAMDMTGFTSLPPSRPLSSSPGPGTRNSDSPAPSMMKHSFSQVSEPVSRTDSPMSAGGAERTKVTIGFGAKRKAGDEPGTPPAKRR